MGVDPYILIPEVHEDYEDLADQELMGGSASVRRKLLKMQYAELRRRNLVRQTLKERAKIVIHHRAHAARAREDYETPAQVHARETLERLRYNSQKALRSYANVRLRDQQAAAERDET